MKSNKMGARGRSAVEGTRRPLLAALLAVAALEAAAQSGGAPPTAGDDGFTVAEDSIDNLLNVLANDAASADDDTDDALTITAVGMPSHGVVSITGGSALLYTPAPNFDGQDSFTYTIQEGVGLTATATVTVTVTAVNDPPVASNDAFAVAEDSQNNNLAVLGNDQDPEGEPLTITAVGQPSHGGSVGITGGSALSYTPAADFDGVETFTYTISDAGGATASATVTVTVTSTNEQPAANDDAFTVDEDSSNNALDVLGNDSDGDGIETVTITGVGAPSDGGTVEIVGGRSLRYTPAADFAGSETFGYTVQDDEGASDTATVTVTVTDVNEQPAANDDAFTVDEDSSNNALDVLANDSDGDGIETVTITAVGAPNRGGQVGIAAGVSLLYTPPADFEGQETFTYTIRDAGGATDTATVAVTVAGVNDAPRATDDAFTVTEDSMSNSLDVLANDADADGHASLRITAVGLPDQGGAVTIRPSGRSLRYSPDAEFNGTETFTYTIGDGTQTATATVRITVTSTADPPAIAPDPIPDQTVEENLPGTVDLAQFVTDADSPVESLRYSLASTSAPLPAGLTLSDVGLISGTPMVATSVGEHRLVFRVTDGTTTTTSAPFTLQVLEAGRVDLGVAVSAAPNPASVEQPVTWTFTITNHAPATGVPSTLLGVVVGGEAPFLFDSAGASGCTIAPAASETTIDCALVTPIAGGGTVTITLTGRGAQAGDVVATARVSVDGAQPIDESGQNDAATATLSIAQAVSSMPGQAIGGFTARAAAAGDVDGDGFTDLVVAAAGAQSTLLFSSTVDPADANKRKLADTPQPLGPAGTGNDVLIADLDGDGDLDIVTAGGDSPNVVLVNMGAGSFQSATLGAASASSRAVAAADIDGDGFVDLVFGNASPNAVYRGTGVGAGFAGPTLIGDGDTRDVVLVNLFGDALPELVAAHADRDAEVFANAGGAFTLDRTLPTGPTTSVATADFNGDGLADLVFGRATPDATGNLSNLVFLNTSASGAGFFLSGELGAAPTVDVTTADIDLDGDADLVFSTGSGAQIFVNASGAFLRHARQIAYPNPLAAAIGSLGTDDRIDLAIVGGAGVAVFYNDGAGNLGLGDTQAPVITLTGPAAVAVTVGAVYADAGATATDDVDGTLDARIVVDNPVDTAVIGTYTVRYDVVDLSGNAAAPVTRTVQVGARENATGGGGGGAVGAGLLALLGGFAAAMKRRRRR